MTIDFLYGRQFCSKNYARLAEIVFRPDYTGYANARGIVEAPNGDGKLDVEKHYSHVSLKNLAAYDGATAYERVVLLGALAFAHDVAEACAEVLKVPAALRPDIRYGALRVLRYPPGATSALHTDFDLFTCHMYQSAVGGFTVDRSASTQALGPALTINPRFHLGEIGELAGLGPATPHEVVPREAERHAIVYFAIPDHAVHIPFEGGTVSVGAWLAERYARSRAVVQ